MIPPILAKALRQPPDLTIAVSGGVDSMTLAHAAHRLRPMRMVHAISPAVPERATALVRDHAARSGWHLTLIDAGEFDDPRYRANPLERCYFCKSNLYDRIAELVGGVIASGTNADDLSDFRPGLRAAGERGVIHPFVEAGMDKAAIRALARAMGLADISDLPAQPCLASRVETGLRVDPGDMALIDRVENLVRACLGADAVIRLRLTRQGAVLETGEPAPGAELMAGVAALCMAAGKPFLGARAYRQGAAFLRERTP
ncbi:MAG: adenine nucleotide alpha hydrolase [Pseudorhodobacter sp.]